MLWRQESSVSLLVNPDPKPILKALSPRGPRQSGPGAESSSPVLPQLPCSRLAEAAAFWRVYLFRDTYVNNVIFNRGDKGRKHHRKLADSKEWKEEEVSLY